MGAGSTWSGRPSTPTSPTATASAAAGRLRTDLGGLYFNAIVAVGIVRRLVGTGCDALLLVIATQILQMLRQLTPLVRFDGYHVLADLTGVPDLYAPDQADPVPDCCRDWRETGEPGAQAVGPGRRDPWVLIVVPLLLCSR